MKDDFSSRTMRNDSTFFENEKEAEVNENILRCEPRNENANENGKEAEIIESEVPFVSDDIR
jgi:hypothetical protein